MAGGADPSGHPVAAALAVAGERHPPHSYRGRMNGTKPRVRLFPFLLGAAIGSLVGVIIGAIFGGPLGDAIENATEGALGRAFGKRDEELRFELLLQ